MKIVQLTYMERINLGNYQHAELTALGVIQEGEDAVKAMAELKTFVQNSLAGNFHKEDVKEAEVAKIEMQKPLDQAAVEEVKEEPKKEKKTKTKKVTGGSVSEDNDLKESGVEKKKTLNVKYDSNVKEHKTIFGSYLTKKYGEAWKTVKPKEEIQAFTKELNGKDFLDDKGTILESFLNEVHGFFG